MYYVNINDVSALEKYKRLTSHEEVVVKHTCFGIFVVCATREQAEWFMNYGSGFCFILGEEMTPQMYIPQEGMYDQTFQALRDAIPHAEACYG